jgi:signal transduction histidine kinase
MSWVHGPPKRRRGASRLVRAICLVMSAAGLAWLKSLPEPSQWLVGIVLVAIAASAAIAYPIIRWLRAHRRAPASSRQQAAGDEIAEIAHRLRDPLSVLRANAETALELERSTFHLRQSRLPRGAGAMVMRELDGLCRQTELLEAIVQQAERMTHQVDGLLGRAQDRATDR